MKIREASGPLTPIDPAMERNIAAMHKLRQESDESRRFDVKIIDAIATFFGGPKALYTHIFIYGSLLLFHFFPPGSDLKPSLDLISMTTSLEAIFLALFVLINQRRTSALERRNSDLHLQMSLLAEHEVTRNAQMLELICNALNVDMKSVVGLEEVKKDVRPQEILEKISEHEKANPTDSNSNL